MLNHKKYLGAPLTVNTSDIFYLFFLLRLRLPLALNEPLVGEVAGAGAPLRCVRCNHTEAGGGGSLD